MVKTALATRIDLPEGNGDFLVGKWTHVRISMTANALFEKPNLKETEDEEREKQEPTRVSGGVDDGWQQHMGESACG
ncbi:hypothetical protein SDC9_132767 [bioreactor metagenome]|uniref:Uncharacterized protein n=1 Tax=bioreactor metagenome TaxID=1076179 RepID=A0A645D8H2_9ZZZZ